MRYFNSSDVSKFQKSFIEEDVVTASVASENVFLSHSSKDQDALASAIKLLKEHGAGVYIDKIDTSLPKTTSPETAKKLKHRIIESEKFIVLVSTHSKDSKWIPWELGLADQLKTLKNIAILPYTDESFANWPEQEYLGIYDRITYGKLTGYSDSVWMVYNHHEHTARELSSWLDCESNHPGW